MDNKKMEKNKKIGILFFQAIKGIKTLKIEGIGYNGGGH